MPDTFSTSLNARKQETGANENTWGDLLNTDVIDVFDHAIAGRTALSLDGGTDVLTQNQNNAAILDITGTLLANQIVQVLNVSKRWIVRNGTTGNFTLTFKTSGGAASDPIPQGGWTEVWCDGDDNVYLGLSSALLSDQLLAADGTEAAPGYSWSSDPNTGLRRTGDDAMALVANGADVVDITTDGAAVTGALSATGDVKHHGDFIVPVGTVLDFGGATAPNGFLLCFGQAVSRSTYSALFDVIGETYGVGNGVTTFNLPDCRGRVSAGQDDMGGTSADRLTNQTGGLNGDTLGATGGAETHTLTSGQMPSYTHTASVTDPGHVHRLLSTHTELVSLNNISMRTWRTGNSASVDTGNDVGSSTTGVSVSNSNTGGGEAHNNVQPTIIFNKMIFTGVYS